MKRNNRILLPLLLTSGSSPVTVDVVPYITAVKTTQTANGGIKVNNIRSSLGRYSIKTGAIANFITIEGFNLNPIANGVRVSSVTYPSGLNGTTLVGNALAVNSVSADRTTVTVSNATAASGYLSVVSGTAGNPVPSANNINDNDSFVDLNGDTLPQLTEKYNREPDELYIKNRLLTDDRYVDFFTVTDTGFTSSFFQSTGELLFRNFRVGLPGGANTLYSTGRSNQADTTVTSGDAARKLVSSSASQYFAMGVTDQNRVVFVYYDQAAGRLKVTYSTAPIDLADPTDAVTFSAPVEIPADYVGWYVSLAVESDGNAGTADPLHIVAYDSSDGDLRSVYMTSYADPSPQIVRVDANNSVGIHTSIKVSGGKPWIGYYNNSENGTRDSIKLARYLGSMATIADGAGGDGYATGQWETLTVPVITPPQGGLTKFLRVNLDFNTTNDPILGYAASSIEASRRLPEVTP